MIRASGGSVRDADGNRVKGTVAGVTTIYIAGLYEWQNGAVTKYYEGGAIRRTGCASDNGVFYVVSEHLRSTSVLVNQNGTVNSRNFYYPEPVLSASKERESRRERVLRDHDQAIHRAVPRARAARRGRSGVLQCALVQCLSGENPSKTIYQQIQDALPPRTL